MHCNKDLPSPNLKEYKQDISTRANFTPNLYNKPGNKCEKRKAS